MVGKIHPDHEELKVDVLIKKSQGKSFVTFEGYQERVFVLDKECLTYYEGNLQQRGPEKGRIYLCNVQCVEAANDKDNSMNVFQVAYENEGVPLILYAFTTTQAQRDDWIQAVKAEALKSGAQFTRFHHSSIWNRQDGFRCCGALSRGDEGCVPVSSWTTEATRPLHLMSSEPGEVMVDIMTKRTRRRNFFFGATHYKERVFVLDTHTLRYFSGTLKKHGKEKCSIDLNHILAVEQVRDGLLEKRKNCFQVVYEEEDDVLTLHIIARTAEKRLAWIEAIRREAKKNNAQFISKYHPGIWLKNMGKYNCCDNINQKNLGCEPVTLNLEDYSQIHQDSRALEQRSPYHDIKVGMLTKRSQNRTRFYALNKYKKRMFVLDKKSLQYYSRKDFKKRQKMKCCIDLTSIVVVAPVNDGALEGNDHCLQVVYWDRDQIFILYMIAKDSRHQFSWINAIAAEATMTGAVLQSQYHCGVWKKNFGKFTCCGQLTKKAPGCKDIDDSLTFTLSTATSRSHEQQQLESSSLTSSSDSSIR
ncbi:uncharacterized protein LOC112558847 isoform X1 [Pomacea canaliculata]|uniref:uncharacterized protein LOC112558847 isoform X1 n=1 Tax=Pomacea canaliculata TaxID=400727 RepID=UPI000D73F827|nr:uncharacterized protein LOC112558847 isoform X1 [Pomacea canaliculata]XP_025085341.1 uncharacterized protein LOC112558847 isoform X1 [Pomacea canaliculata]XP_025085342.1 uncharacterized protein LOC112558847 isoform X1 [Pomacea canaliculata]XP_025085343.1 uncharacterized protein LOC112558847 isoform X1 [Pomacea canaliculata]